MYKKFLGILLIISLGTSAFAKTNNNFVAVNGILELGLNNVLESNTIKLQGNWEFYWNQLYEPKDFKDLSQISKPEFVKVPKSWATYKINGQKLPPTGYATYRLIIHKKSDKEKEIYGLNISTIFTSYKLWVNGKLLANVGKVGKTKESSEPAFKYQNIPFILDPVDGPTDTVEIIIQVSNYSHQRAGLHSPIYFSTYNNILTESRWMDILNLVIIGIIIIIGINYLTLYFFRKDDRSNLYFGITCLVMFLRNISTGDRIITYVFPNINWELLMKLDNFSGFGTIPLFGLFAYLLFKDDFPKIVRDIFLYIGLIITLLVITTPAIIYGKIRIFFELYVLVFGLYIILRVLLVASIRKRKYALPTFLGMLILYSTAMNDVLSSMGIISTAYVAPYGLVTFMLIQSITINNKSASAINENEELSAQLTLEKGSLESRIEERTSELQLQHNELMKHQEKEQSLNWINVGIAQINEVVSKDKDNYKELCKNVLIALIQYLDAKIGALYVLNTDKSEDPYLEIVADYGLSKEQKSMNSIIPTNSGLIGATFTNNEVQLISNIPDNYLAINSGLGCASPKSLLIAPMCFEKSVLGVIELASFKEIKPVELEYVTKVAYIVANNLNTVRMNEHNVLLIQQLKEHTGNMQQNEEETRQQLEELKAIEETLNARNIEIEKINAELNKKNKEFEEYKQMMSGKSSS